MSTQKTRRDWLGWAACAFALAVTFAAEYELARAVGINEVVSLAVPGALDVYVLRALQMKRDVLGAVLALILVNSASHLVTAKVLPVDWWLIVAVSSVAPLVLWRAHVLRAPVTASTEEPEHGRAPDDTDGPGTREHPELGVTGAQWPVPESAKPASTMLTKHPEHSVPLWDDSFPDDLPVLVGHEARVPTVDEHAAEVIELCSEPVNGSEHDPAPVLKLVPPSVEHDPLMSQARVLLERNAGNVPTVRALKSGLGVGTPRAQRIRDVLVTEAREAQKKGTEA